MIDAGLIASGFARQADRSTDSTMRLTRAYTIAEQKRPTREEQAEKVAQDFEELFLSQMLDHMVKDSLGSEFFGSEESTDFYRSIMVQEYGKQITRSGGIGVADYVKRELLKVQEVQHGQ